MKRTGSPAVERNGELADDTLSGGGEMGALMRSFDWAATPLGAPGSWPQSLKTAVSICLNSRFPIVLWWGPDLRLIYNDAWRPSLGAKKHPAVAKPGREVWAEIWHLIGPMLEGVLATATATWSEDMLLPMDRYGFLEETYWTYSYSPIRVESGGVGGAFTAVQETTDQVLGQRRLKTLKELGAATTAATVPEAYRLAVAALAGNPNDVPFAAIYDLAAEPGRAVLAATTPGLEAGGPATPVAVDLAAPAPWPLAAVARSGGPVDVDDVGGRFGPLPAGGWPNPPERAVLLPLRDAASDITTGILVAGASAGLAFTDDYRNFFALVAGQIATAIANARAYEAERRRAEQLAELDRAKTAFFSNVSHEFRTPLTLMLGPAEEALRAAADPEQRERLELLHRNALRLQKLVNALLDFSRIEAGRMRATYAPTDLAALTAELASNFRSACERAGLSLSVDCPPLPEPVYVDREMWEKVVLNLLSNAFKFTLEGGITASLRADGDGAVLIVSDTGTGIDPDALPHVFERFHRVEGARARTHEGTGIGLALVQELVKLHGGTVAVESELGRGTTFTVTVPFGRRHLPADQVREAVVDAGSAVRADAFVEEALRWLPGGDQSGGAAGLAEAAEFIAPTARPEAAHRPMVLLADDNADMREYVRRLLSPHYDVVAVADGEQALARAREKRPDLVLTDVMMPRLDGFGLLRALRSAAETAAVPVVLLSARAGEEATVEGLEAGADDYLVKPFSAKELLARVGGSLALARVRREAARREADLRAELTTVLESMTDGFVTLDPGWCFTYVNAAAERLVGVGRADVLGKNHWELFPATVGSPVEAAYRRALADRVPASCENFYPPLGRWFEVNAYPVAGGGIAVYFRDVTERKAVEARERLVAEANAKFRTMFEQGPLYAGILAVDGTVMETNRHSLEFSGFAREEVIGRLVWECGWWNPSGELQELMRGACREAASGRVFRTETRYYIAGGEERYVDLTLAPVADDSGRILFLALTGTDVTDRRRAAERLKLLDAVGQATRDAADPAAVMTATSRLVGEHLGVTRCAYADVETDNNRFTIRHDWTADGATTTVGCYLLDLFGSRAAADMRQGRTLVVRDVDAELSARDGADMFNAIGIKAIVCCPLVKEGRLVAMMAVHQDRPRGWAAGEVALVEEVVERSWAHIERVRAEEALREADRRKDEFLATLAHELRNPLAPVRNGLTVLRLSPPGSAPAAKARDMMERQLGHMVRLIDDLLDVSRVSRGKVELKKERVEFHAVVESAVETSRPLVEAGRHALDVRLPEERLWLDADPTRLAQVVSNLLNNAAKYTPDGGRIVLSARRDGAEVVVAVSDTGVGIPADELPKVFDLFTQVGRSLDRAQGGLGIGLSLVRKLTEMHGGTVEAESPGPGRGSTFTVRLPLAGPDGDERGGPEPAVPPGRSAAGRRVLVVDDNRDGAESLALMLEIYGHEPRVVHDGAAALEAARTFRPEVVFLDIGMPGMNGYEVATALRSDPASADVVLVALTGWGSEDDKKEAARAGFDFHLTKPAEAARVEALLATLVPRPA